MYYLRKIVKASSRELFKREVIMKLSFVAHRYALTLSEELLYNTMCVHLYLYTCVNTSKRTCRYTLSGSPRAGSATTANCRVPSLHSFTTALERTMMMFLAGFIVRKTVNRSTFAHLMQISTYYNWETRFY